MSVKSWKPLNRLAVMKKKTKNVTQSKETCPECGGERAIVKECMDCWGVGCLECDGQGYIAWDCERCAALDERETK